MTNPAGLIKTILEPGLIPKSGFTQPPFPPAPSIPKNDGNRFSKPSPP